MSHSSLGEVATFINGYGFGPEDWHDEGLPIVRIANLTDPSKPYTRSRSTVPDRFHVRKGELLVSWSATLDVFEWQREEHGLVNQHIFRVIPDTSKVDQNYLKIIIRKALFDMERHMHGSTMKHVNRGEFLGTKIALPPLTEQRRIADILDRADTLKRKRQQALQLAADFLRATFLDMFGDPETNPKAWKVRPMGECAANLDGRRIPIKEADRTERSGDFPYYGASGIIDWVDDYIFDGRYLLIGEDGANLIARSTPIAFQADGKLWVNNHAHVLEENGICRLNYLEHFFANMDVKKYITGSAQPKLTQAALNRIPVPVPPMDSQARFDQVCSLTAKTCASFNDAKGLISDVHASINYAVFAGTGGA